MARLKTLPPRLAKAPSRQMETTSTRERRMTGRRLQDRRWRLWQKDPHCSRCGRLVEYPGGFELDHKIPIYLGGEDTEDNCQILCVYVDPVKGKSGCHIDKTKSDMGL